MAMLTAEQYASSYVEGMSSARAKKKYQEGIDRTTENPMAKAAERDDYYLQRVQESVTSGKRKAKLLAVPMSRWKENARTEGANRLASGAAKAKSKMVQAWQTWGPVAEQARAAAASMPRGGREEAKARVARVIDIYMDAAGRS